MEEFGFESKANSASGDQKQTNSPERLLSIQRCIKYLVHALQCRDESCRLPSCQKMKRVVQHAKSCKRMTNERCPICKQLIGLSCYHAKTCQEAKCLVPFCANFKIKFRQQKLQILQKAQISNKRVATMQNYRMSGDVVQPSPGNSNSSSQQQPTQAWQQLVQILKSPPSAQQQQQVLAILKSNPQLMAAFIKQRTAQQQQLHQREQLQQQQILLNEGNMITPPPLDVWCTQPQQQHLLEMQRQQQQLNQLDHPQPPMYPQSPRMSTPMNFGYQLGFQGDGSQFQFQQHQQLMQPQIKRMASPTHLSASPQQLQEQQQRNVIPEITKPAPDFEGIAVVNGTFKNIKLTDYKGKYLVLFFYPSTYVCPAEIIAFSEKVEDFKRINCEIIGCSTVGHLSHLAWINTPREGGGLGMMNIPLLADESFKISKDYGVVSKENEDLTFRGLFIIDGSGILRQITISDLPVDKSVNETLHFVEAFQNFDQYL